MNVVGKVWAMVCMVLAIEVGCCYDMCEWNGFQMGRL